jgi:hypothetical protein
MFHAFERILEMSPEELEACEARKRARKLRRKESKARRRSVVAVTELVTAEAKYPIPSHEG